VSAQPRARIKGGDAGKKKNGAMTIKGCGVALDLPIEKCCARTVNHHPIIKNILAVRGVVT